MHRPVRDEIFIVQIVPKTFRGLEVAVTTSEPRYSGGYAGL